MSEQISPEEIEKVAKLFRYPFEDIRGIRESEWTATSESERILYCSAAKYHLEQTASLRQEIEGLRKDKERLDWLQANVNNIDTMTVSNREQEIEYCVFWMTHRNNFYGKTLREALDAAVQQAKEAK